MPAFQVKRLGYALGAEISGLDLRRPLDAQTRQALYQAWLDHHVLVFRGQELTAEEQIRFSGTFGDLDHHEAQPSGYLHPEHDEILLITNQLVNGKPSETRRTGRNWHADLTYTRNPTKGTLLVCKECPSVGGDTLWANTHLAYDTLSPLLKDLVDKLEALYMAAAGKHMRGRSQNDELIARNPPVIHPLVIKHSDTGRKALRAGQRVQQLVGLSEEESQAILAFLNQHITSLEFTYRHRWAKHDVVLWDNRSTLHIALPDFDQSEERTMYRCSLLGQASGRLAEVQAPPDRESLLQELQAVS